MSTIIYCTSTIVAELARRPLCGVGNQLLVRNHLGAGEDFPTFGARETTHRLKYWDSCPRKAASTQRDH